VLWHEFCHVITLTATQNRMPRWLSEGISVYEERQANPAWGERMNLAYRDLILKGELTPLGELSGAFLSPSNSVQLQFAYFESSLVVEFIVQQFGFDTLKKILSDLHDGEEINPSIAKRTLPLPELEKKFAAFARAQAEQLAPGVDLDAPPSARRGDSENSTWALLHPKNFNVQLETAAKLMREKQWAEAKPLLESLANAYHGESKAGNPLWLLAVTQRNLGETNAEVATLKKLAVQEADFVDLYARLIELSEAQKDWPAVTHFAELLLAVNPLISLPHRALATAGMATGNAAQAITANRKLLLLDPPDPVAVHFQLAALLHQRGDAEAEARRQILKALEDAPRYRDAQRLLLEIAAKSPQPGATNPTSVPLPDK
jgi:tetratricopeptide (TPR) repeat protein